jgi:hypothetical protein
MNAQIMMISVTLTKAGIHNRLEIKDSDFRWTNGKSRFPTFCESININLSEKIRKKCMQSI